MVLAHLHLYILALLLIYAYILHLEGPWSGHHTLLQLAFLIFLLMQQFFYLYLLDILYLVLLHFLLRSHYFLLAEFLDSHNLLQYFLFPHLIFQVLLLDIILQLHKHYLILSPLNIFCTSFLRYVVSCKNNVNVIMILVCKGFLILYNF